VSDGLGLMLDELEAFLRRYVVVSDAQAAALTLWVAHTHAIDATDTTPYLHITSAEAECGKSRVMELLELVVRGPLTTAGSMTVAVMYRAIDARSPTLLLDEADNVFADRTQKAELLGVVNSGWRRGQYVLRMAGPQHDRLADFSTFCAKAIAGLDAKLASTLASRCLRIEMRRRRADEPIAAFYVDEARAWSEPIRDDLAAWAEASVDALRAARPERLGVRDRLEEGLRLLLAIGEAAGEEWSTRARTSLRELAEVSLGESETHRVQLLRDVRAVFGDRDELTTSDLLAGLFAIEESPWAEWWADARPGEDQRPSKGAAMKLARTLKPFGVRPGRIGPEKARLRGYRLNAFADAFARYLPAEVGQVGQMAWLSQESSSSGRPAEGALSAFDGPANPDEQRNCPTCPTRSAHDGESGSFPDVDEDEIERLAELARVYEKPATS
jgi:Protein of unknown function (DUF3631)